MTIQFRGSNRTSFVVAPGRGLYGKGMLNNYSSCIKDRQTWHIRTNSDKGWQNPGNEEHIYHPR